MSYDVQLKLPAGWQLEQEVYEDESGAEITHLEAHLYDEADSRDTGLIDVYVGEMPEDTTARDQALSNYADIVGFDEEDPEDFDPISCIQFNGKKAYVFEALCEDDSPMMFLAQEVRQGVLAIVCCAADSREALTDVVQCVERNLRVRG